jgi:hypothetical protein
MQLRRCTVERPFAILKAAGARVEISLPTLAYNLKTMMNTLGAAKLAQALAC